MTTKRATSTKKTASAASKASSVPSELQHFSIKEAAALLCVSHRWLAGKVAAREVACTFVAGRAKFTAAHIQLISRAGEINPAAIGRRPIAA